MDASVLVAIISVGGMGLIFGGGLAFASKKFYVEVDPRVEAVQEILPGANCGACGKPGCSGLALAVVKGELEATACTPGGKAVAEKIGAILGVEVETLEEMIAVVRCQGTKEHCPDRFEYQGVPSCTAATLVGSGHKSCNFGCLGFGECVDACPFDAMYMGKDKLPRVIAEKCNGCGKCVEACPRGIMALIPRRTNIYIACVNENKAKDVRAVCDIGCTGCGVCAMEKICPSGIITMNDETNLPVFNYEIDDEPLVAVNKCPTNSLVDKLQGKRPTFFISDTKCIGSGECAKVCPVKKCIEKLDSGKHVIHAELCIGCALCEPVCPSGAISVMGALGHQKMAG